MNLRAYVSCVMYVVCCASTAGAGVVAERELLLRNTLAMPREDEIVAVTFEELRLEPTLWDSVADVSVVADDGTEVPAQFDNFAAYGPFVPEVALSVTLAPLEKKRLVFRLHDIALNKPVVCRVGDPAETFDVTTPEFIFPVCNGGPKGLWVEQPRRNLSGEEKQAQTIDDLLGDVLEPESDDKSLMAMPAAATPKGPDLKPPMASEGLPFCIQGMWGFSRQARLVSWGGPLRAVVSLIDVDAGWRLAKTETRATARQTFWFPRKGARFHLDIHADLDSELADGSVSFAGCRVNSDTYEWTVIMGQNGRPPHVVPYPITLRNSRKPIVLEPYQSKTFNDIWYTANSKAGWVGLIVDRRNSRLGGPTTVWGSGSRKLNSRILFSDPGPYANSLQPRADFDALPAGSDIALHATVLFGEDPSDEADVGQAAAAVMAGLPVMAPESAPHPEASMERIRELAEQKSVLVVVPDVGTDARSGLWKQVADRLGGMWRESQGVMHFFNVMSGGEASKDLLTVVVGEPGTGALFDRLNARYRVMNAYPLAPERERLALIEETEGAGPILFVAGNREAGTEAAVAALVERFGPAPERPNLVVSERTWEDRMPFPWSGLRRHEGPFTTSAYRYGTAEFLLLARANTDVSPLTLELPQGIELRSVQWRFDSEFVEPRVVPLHDAAFPGAPASLRAGDMIALWLRVRIPANAQPGTRRDVIGLQAGSVSRDIVLETHVLSPVLPDTQAIGFYPMGFSRSMIKRYYDWDDATYVAKLPKLLTERREFGPNAFSLDTESIVVTADDDGNVSIDASALRDELRAIRSAGCIDLLEFRTLNNIVTGRELAKIVRARGLHDSFEAWEFVIPEVRALMEDLDLAGKATCRHGDEIADYEAWLGTARLYQRCGLLMTVAINGYGVFNKRLGVGTMGFWIPLYNFTLNRWGNPIPDDDPLHFSKQFRDERHRAGEQIWPYVCGPGPYAWSARPRSQARFLILDTYMKGMDGLSYYGGHAWSHSLAPAYRDKEKAPLFKMDCTFTTLFYPDAEHDAILPSLRAGAFRIGLEDATATKAVRALAAERGRTAEVETAIQAAYGRLTMDSERQAFTEYRTALSRLWDGLQ